jgi:hypothetical protein
VVAAKGLSRRSLLILALLMILVGLLLWGRMGQQANAQAVTCWKAEITQQWTNLDLAGSVLRVSVQGKSGLPIVVRSVGGFGTIGFAGTKPEYGPYVAEFAPLSKGTYYIEPQGLGTIFEVWLDGKNYTRVDFTPVPCAPTPTPTPRPATTPRPREPAAQQPGPTALPAPAPTQTPSPAGLWRGRVAQHLEGLEGRYFATIAVRVIGRPAGQQVEIRSEGWSEMCTTGTKPEHGPDACEFGALVAGTYRLTPQDLGTHLDVTVGLQDFVLVEFYYAGPPPGTRWVGSVIENSSGSQATEHANSAIAVVVSGRPWHEVAIRSDGWTTACTTGTKPDIGPDACEFGGLRAGTYTVTPKDLGTSVAVTVDGWGWALVRFDEVPVLPPQPAGALPPPTARPATATRPAAAPSPGPTEASSGWQGWVISNTSGEREGTGIWSVIVVRVLNHAGVAVQISAGGGWSATCITGTKPEHGPDACEFGGLWPSIYSLQPEGADVQLEVEMDGMGVAFVEFAPP